MEQAMRTHGPARVTKILIAVAGALLLVPLIAMRFTSEVNWTPLDFGFAIVMMGSAILGVELATRFVARGTMRIAVYAAIALGFALIWIEAAVGIFD